MGGLDVVLLQDGFDKFGWKKKTRRSGKANKDLEIS